MGAGGDGEVAARGAAADHRVAVVVEVYGIGRVVAAAAEVGAPEQRVEGIVELKDHGVLLVHVVALGGPRRGGEVGAHGGAADVGVAEDVADNLAACAVAVVVVQGVVALHDDLAASVVVPFVVEAVVVVAANERGGLQRGAVGAETRHEDVAPVGEGYRLGVLVVDAGAAGKPAPVGVGRRGKVVAPGGAEDEQLVEVVDIEAVRHIGLRAAEVGGVEALAAGGVKLEDAYVRDARRAVEGGVVGAQRGGVADAEDEACSVSVLVRVVGARGAPVVGQRARVGGEA